MRVCLIGGADSRLQAPFDRSDVEVWAVNDCFVGLPRVDRIFEIHPFFEIGGVWYRRGMAEWRGWKVNDYLSAMDKTGAMVWMQESNPKVERSVSFPIDVVLKEFPRRYFTSTISYMMAWAIHLAHIKEINLFGIDLYGMNFAIGDEYMKQRPCIEYLIGIAEGRGITVNVSKDSALLSANQLYGFDEGPQSILNYKMEKIKTQIKEGAYGRREAEIGTDV